MGSVNVKNLFPASLAISRLRSKSFLGPSSGEARRPPSFAESSGELRRDLAEALAEAGSAFDAKAAAGFAVTKLVLA